MADQGTLTGEFTEKARWTPSPAKTAPAQKPPDEAGESATLLNLRGWATAIMESLVALGVRLDTGLISKLLDAFLPLVASFLDSRPPDPVEEIRAETEEIRNADIPPAEKRARFEKLRGRAQELLERKKALLGDNEPSKNPQGSRPFRSTHGRTASMFGPGIKAETGMSGAFALAAGGEREETIAFYEPEPGAGEPSAVEPGGQILST